jgi:hypothetical protein
MRHLLAAFAAAILIVAPAVTIPPPANADTSENSKCEACVSWLRNMARPDVSERGER